MKNVRLHGGKFKITQAVIRGCNFVFAEAEYLLRLSLIPLVLSLVCGFYIELVHAEAGLIERFLWELPATIAFAWYMFLITRRIMTGERIDRMTRAELLAFPRQRSMRVSVITALLFNMLMTSFAAFIIWNAQKNIAIPQDENRMMAVVFMFCVGAAFWALRLGFAPILGAIDAPIRKFLFLVNGMGFSFRVIGLVILCIMPVSFVEGVFVSVILKDYTPFERALTPEELYMLIPLNAVTSLVAYTLLNASACFALKEIFARDGDVL